MKVELIKVELTNYRNIDYACYEFDGNSKIVGENRIGKTNTLEAIVWLLTDKLLNGSNDVQGIKPINDTRKEVRVEGTFSLWDEKNPQIPPRTIVLRKEYGEDWVKTRGTEIETLKGHYLTYYYNGVKQKTKKDWYELFNEDFGLKGDYKGIDIVQLLTNPFYIGDLGESDSWTDLRAFIIQLIGNVKDEDVFKAQPSTMVIQEELKTCGGRLDQLKKQYSNEIKGLKEQLIGDEANIKMLEQNPGPTDDEVAIALKGKEEIDIQIAKLQSDKNDDSLIIALEKELIEKKNKLLELQSGCILKDTTSDLADRLATLNEEYRELLVSKTQMMEERTRLQVEVENAKKDINVYMTFRTQTIAKLREIDAKLQEPFDAICPTCNRPLEGEQLELAKQKHFEMLNTNKQEIIVQGKKNRALLDEAIEIANGEKLKEFDIKFKELEKAIEEKKEQITKVNDELNIEKAKPRELVENSQVYAYKQVIKDIEKRIEIAKSDLNAANSTIKALIADLDEKQAPYLKVLTNKQIADHQKMQLDTVKSQRQQHALKLASFEQKAELINLFMRVKLEMLDDKVKTVFGNIRFQLVNANLKEGSYNPVCKPYIYNVDKDESTNVTWRNGSKSERVITGIAIAECIKRALGLADLPFLFDEGGEISTDTFSSKFKTNSQLICVKVQDNINRPMIMKI